MLEKCAYGGFGGLSDVTPAGFIVGDRLSLDGVADPEGDGAGTGPTTAGGQALVGAVDGAGKNGGGGGGGEASDARFEGAQNAGAGAGAFGKKDEDVVVGSDALTKVIEGVGGAAFPPKGECIEKKGGEPGADCAGKEGVPGGNRVDAGAPGGRKAGGEDEQIEVAVVVGCEDEGGAGREMLGAVDAEVVALEEVKGGKTEGDAGGDGGQVTAFAAGAAEASPGGHTVVGGWLIVPIFHGCSGSAAEQDVGRHIETDAAEVADVMKEGGTDEEEAIETVEQAAVTGNQGAHIFDAEIPFDAGDNEVAELGGDGEQETANDEMEGMVERGVDEEGAGEPGEEQDDAKDGAESAGEGFVGAGVGGEFGAAEQFPEEIGKDIVEFGAEQDEEQERLKETVICQITKVAEAGAEEEECHGGERDTLEVAVGAVGLESTQGEEGNHEGRDGDKKAIPMIHRGKTGE